MEKLLKLPVARLPIVMVLSFWVLLSNILAQDKVAKIDEAMTKVVENRQFNGSVLVAEKGKVIYKKGFGYADMDWKIANQADTKFRIGSITKQFVATQIIQLVSEGKVKLDDKISDYLPEYRKDTGEKITIHHLLTHTSGIPSYTGLSGFWSDSTRNPYEVDYMVKNFHSGDLEFEPGSTFRYNNTGYYLLAVIIEKVTGRSFEENLQERILKPAGMGHTGVDRNERIIDKKAKGYMKDLAGTINEPYFYMPNVLGAGDMYSTVEDLYRWDQILYTEKVLSAKYKDIMFTPFLNNYAYGWGVYNVALGESTDSVAVVSHTGGINGFNTIIFRLIQDRHLVVLLNNTGSANLGSISRTITNILYNRPYKLPQVSIGETIGRTILKDGIGKALQLYRDLKETQSATYNFAEGELNTLGYQLLGMNRVNDAIEIFKLNVEMFPEAFNPYDSLGEAYMINGEKTLAIKNYAKSLELNPGNVNAINMLQRANRIE